MESRESKISAYWRRLRSREPIDGLHDPAREREFRQKISWGETPLGGGFRGPMGSFEDADACDGGVVRIDTPVLRHRSLVGGSL